LATHALDRHLVLVGFMGAGKTTLGEEAARRLGRPFHDVDADLERESGATISAWFDERGEAEFRAAEAGTLHALLDRGDPLVIALGGGAVESDDVRTRLRDAFTVLVDVAADTAWQRSRGTGRPLARDEAEFRARYERRAPLYDAVADARATDADGAVLAAAGVHVRAGSHEHLSGLVPGTGRTALVTDARVAGIHGADAQLALGARLASTHELPPGEEAKTVTACARLWEELQLDRGDTLVALGGGCTIDAAGFVAATYLRGVAWVTVPTTLVGQVDAAIGGKTAINLPAGKNLVGAFHWPARTVVDPALLETLPEAERRNGLAEVVKTGLLAGEPLWELPPAEQVRRCAAFKAAVCLRDPYERGERAILNLGHTFAHALEAAGSYGDPSHGEAVGLGLLAALRLSGLDTSFVEETLEPRRVAVDPELAWAALRRDKKSADGRIRLVLLEAPGRPRTGVELPDRDVRAALDDLIAT
jgi:shikimate kinase / 3-dehydroquinate synthase